MALNFEQQAAVDSDNHTLVVAPPGSGKTALSVEKVRRLLVQNPNARVGAVTFTRDSAQELQERIEKKVGKEDAKNRVLVGTFHRHAIRQMSAAKRSPTILSPSQQNMFIFRALKETGLANEISFQDAVKLIENTKTSIDLTAETLAAEKLFNAYQGYLRSHGACDMQDLIRMALEGMRNGIIKPLPVDFLIIDEYQDTDLVQFHWALEHVKAGAIITVVGDDDQSIYGWRHALGYAGMMNMKDALQATQVTLSINYRCREEILYFAKRLIAYNTDRVEKELVADHGKGGEVQCVQCQDRDNEGDRIAEFALSLPGRWEESNGLRIWKVAPKSTAVLARSNHLLRAVAEALDAEGVDYKMGGGKDMWSEVPLCHLAGALQSFAKNSIIGLELALDWLGYPSAFVQYLHEETDGKIGKFSRIEEIPESVEPDAKINKKCLELVRLVQGWKKQLEVGRLQLVVNSVSQLLASGPMKPKERKLLTSGTRLLAERLRGSLAERLRVVTRKRDESADDDECVRLMTMHGSKGLEFENVWVMGVEDEVIPSVPQEGEASPIEEERRLLYVAMTRAKEKLVVSYVVTPSFFLKESGLLEIQAKDQ